MVFLNLLVAIFPVFLIGFYIYIKDKEKESSSLLFKLFIFGILASLPVIFIGMILNLFFPEMEYMNFFQLLFYVFFSIALVEEFFKWIFTYKIAYTHSEFDSTYDMIVYAVFVSLGFACFENVLYVYEYGILTGIFRGILSVPGHACDGILMGIYLGMAKLSQINGDNKSSSKYKLLSILIPVVSHGVYDFCLFWASPLFLTIFVVFVISLDILCIKKVKDISKNDFKFRYKFNFCKMCGRKVNSNYCPQCGNKNM